MIDRSVASRFITRLYEETKYQMDILDEKGVVLATTNLDRYATFNKHAYDMAQSGENVRVIRGTNSNIGINPGVIFSVQADHSLRGFLYVMGEPEDIYKLTNIMKLSLEQILESEDRYSAYSRQKSAQQAFSQALLYGEHISAEKLNLMARRLDINEKCLRIPIMIVAEPKQIFSEVINRSVENPQYHRNDLAMTSRSNRIVMFKTLDDCKGIAEMREAVEDYIQWWKAALANMQVQSQFNIGTVQNALERYREGYQHAVWLVTNARCLESVNYFYDYTGLYFRSKIPMTQYQNVFEAYSQQLDKAGILNETLFETVAMLDKCNYNFNRASELLFVHKNTVSFRIDKIKSLLNIDPVKKAADRDLLSNVIYYLEHR